MSLRGNDSLMIMDLTGSNLLDTNDVVDKRWKIIRAIGAGLFGAIVYEVTDLQRSPRIFNMKVESTSALGQDDMQPKYLPHEKQILDALHLSHATSYDRLLKVEAFAELPNFFYMVFGIYGPSLREILRELPRKKFSLRTVMHIAETTLKLIEELHLAGYVHRDIKPGNIVIGKTAPESHKLFLMNFELCKKYVDDRGKIITPSNKVEFRSTPRYASVEALKEKEIGPIDDTWAWFYSIIELTAGKIHLNEDKAPKGRANLLPWLAKEKQRLENNSCAFLSTCPSKYRSIYEHLCILRYEELPDYQFLTNIIRTIVTRRNLNEDLKLDWQMMQGELEQQKDETEISVRQTTSYYKFK